MSAPPFPGTSASAASKSATGNSTPRSRRLTSHCQGARNESRRNRSSALGKAFRSGGTESSNPASSSGESGANSTRSTSHLWRDEPRFVQQALSRGRPIHDCRYDLLSLGIELGDPEDRHRRVPERKTLAGRNR